MSSNASNSRRQARRKSDKRIASIVAKAVAKVVPQIVAQVQSLNNSQSSAGSKADASKPNFYYKHFKACEPMTFTGEEGVSQLFKWFNAIEVTLRQSGCPEHFRTTCATGVFQSRALDWWTAECNKRGDDAAYALSWSELKELMKREYCPPHEVQKLANEFWSIKQIGSDNAGLTARFKQLSIICPSQVDTTEKAIKKYIDALPECVGSFVQVARPSTIEETYQLAAEINADRVAQGYFSENPTKNLNQVTVELSDDSDGESEGESGDESEGESEDGSEDESEDNSENDSEDNSSDDDDSLPQDTTEPSRKRKSPSYNYAASEPQNPEPLRSIPCYPKRNYTGPHPQCWRCTYHHPTEANCRYCDNCKIYGHYTIACRTGPRQQDGDDDISTDQE